MAFLTKFFLKSFPSSGRKSLVFGLLLLFWLPGTLFAEQSLAQGEAPDQTLVLSPMRLKQSENYWILTDGLWVNPSDLILLPKTKYLDLWSRLELTTNSFDLELEASNELRKELEFAKTPAKTEPFFNYFKVGCISFCVGVSVGVIVTSLLMTKGGK